MNADACKNAVLKFISERQKEMQCQEQGRAEPRAKDQGSIQRQVPLKYYSRTKGKKQADKWHFTPWRNPVGHEGKLIPGSSFLK
jgi:hypothetical protein